MLVNTAVKAGRYAVDRRYLRALREAGLDFFLVPPALPEPERLLGAAAGVLFVGGRDYPAGLYGAQPDPAERPMDRERAEFDFRLAQAVLREGLPALGICGGCQLLNIACGGTLVGDIGRLVPGALRHWEERGLEDPEHPVQVEEDTLLHRWLGRRRLLVNSYHHQSVERPGEGVLVSARAPDGVAEAVEVHRGGGVRALGVQWHPERSWRRDEASRRIFRRFAEWVRRGGPWEC